MQSIFTNIYENAIWENTSSLEYKGGSGQGSSIDYNITKYIPFLKEFIINNNIKHIVDLGCGDFRCGKLIYDDLDIIYTGYDVYNKIIEYNQKNNLLPKYKFIHLYFYNSKEDILSSDICILKDVIQHWSLNKIYNFLDYIIDSKKFKYILICNCCNQTRDNTDINDGDVRPLSIKFLPLRKYNLIEKLKYNTKEVSIIQVY